MYMTSHYILSVHRCEECWLGGGYGGGNIPRYSHCHINHLARLPEEREEEV